VNLRVRQGGFNLTELMVAITIGLILLSAFLVTLDRCRTEFAANTSVASLQDGARHALSVLVPDLEHAGFLGFSAAAAPQLVRDLSVVADSVAMRQPDSAQLAAPVAGLPAGAHECGTNFAIDLSQPVQMSNNSYPEIADGCEPSAVAGGARAGSDTLTIRHASLETVEPRAGRLQVYSRRLESQGFVSLFADGNAPGPVDHHSEIRDLEVRTYYVSNNSVGRTGWPALRVKALTESRGAAQFRDEEILPGVEDLQVEFVMIDDDEVAGRTRHGSPDLAFMRGRQVVAVRLWLRLRADNTEGGYQDARPLSYADVAFIPQPAERGHRRKLVARTVALRNRRE
jgi:prepilin-type N-terminal cleavage/methylation domain-containing protein